MKSIILLLLVALCGTAQGLRICGNYCGPGWCNAAAIAEADCNGTVAPDGHVDSCCREHDRCCGFGDRRVCNGNLIECVDRLVGDARGAIKQHTQFLDEGAVQRWIERYFFEYFFCGNGSTAISDFFIGLGFFDKTLMNRTMCCGTQCG